MLGTLEVVDSSGHLVELRGSKLRTLLAALLLRAGQPVSADQLADLIWGDAPPSGAANALQAQISKLRRLLVDAPLEGRDGGYVLVIDPQQIDAERFTRLTKAGHEHLAAGRHAEAAAVLREGLALWRGPALADFVKALDPLGAKRGPLLAQTPAEFQHDDDTWCDLVAFLGAKPEGLQLAIEFRNASWHTPEVIDLLRHHNVAVAWTEWRDLPRLTDITADFLYLRWLGDRREIAKYDRVQIDRAEEFASWEGALMSALGQVKEVYGYFNNHWAGHSPESANEMKRRLGLSTVDPKEQWPQKELF